MPHPVTASLLFTIVLFVVLLVVFHFALRSWLKHDKVAWKKLDYAWLTLAALSLLSAPAQIRVPFAQRRIEEHQLRVTTSFATLRRQLDWMASTPGIVCRKFVQSEPASPDSRLDQTQAEYDKLCDWIKHVALQVPQHPATPPTAIDASKWRSPPAFAMTDLRQDMEMLTRLVEYYNVEVSELQETLRQSQSSELESLLVVLGPILLAVGLAIRVSKVTGEVRIEKAAVKEKIAFKTEKTAGNTP